MLARVLSFLTGFIKNKPTQTATDLSITAHGLTKNKELIELLYKHGVGISYKDTLMLRDFWTYNDLINSHFCPVEIPEDVPCVVIVDNDDFKSDTLTGEATSAHRTNVMFVQPGSLEVKPDESSDRSIGKEVIASTVDQVCDDYNKLSAYKATERKNIPTR